MNTKKKFVVLERLQGFNTGVKYWTLNKNDNIGYRNGSPLHREVLFTNDSSEAIAECNRKTDNDE